MNSRTLHHCNKCGHDWLSGLPQPPIRCPRCRCMNWTNPKRPQAVGPDGKRIVYPFHDLEIGQSVTIPWPLGTNGETDPRKAQNINNAVRQEERRKEKKFTREGKGSGLTVTRVA